MLLNYFSCKDHRCVAFIHTAEIRLPKYKKQLLGTTFSCSITIEKVHNLLKKKIANVKTNQISVIMHYTWGKGLCSR